MMEYWSIGIMEYWNNREGMASLQNDNCYKAILLYCFFLAI